MNLGIRSKLFLISLGLIAVSVVAADLLVTSRLVPVIVQEMHEDVYVRLDLMEREVSEAALNPNDLAAWDTLADSLGRRARTRVTIIRRDGALLGDSEMDIARILDAESHAGRPEVMAALSSGRGESTRWSQTLRERMAYIAVPFRQHGEIAGVVRAAVPLATVDRAVARFRALVAVGSALALGVAVVLSSLAAHWMSRSVRALTSAARRMAAGDLSGRTRAVGRDEVAELGRALDRMAENLGRTLEQLRGERDLRERILHDMREGVLLLGPDGRVAMVNPALREMWILGETPSGGCRWKSRARRRSTSCSNASAGARRPSRRRSS